MHDTRFQIPAAPLRYLREGLNGPHRAVALDWYADALEGCEIFAARHGIPLERVVGHLAVTSPRVDVARNASLAAQSLLEGPDGLYLPSHVASVRHFDATGEIRGPKTRAFYHAILGDPSAVVVDVWVARAIGETGRLEGARYKRAENVIRSLAGKVGISPREAQACIWYGARAAAGYVGGVTRLRIDGAAERERAERAAA
jgi:hypothetical protein